MNTQTKLLLLAMAGGVALGFGGASVFGGVGASSPLTATSESETDLAAKLRVVEADREALQQAVLETQERIAAITRELDMARADVDAMRAEHALAAASATLDDDAFWDAELDETMELAEADGPTFRTDAELEEARAARAERGRQWDPERIAAMRAERNERVQGFFDDAFERAPSRESQERLAAIEAYTQDAMELMRDWRGASESEREAMREQMGSMREAMRDLVREEHDARVREVAARAGVTDVNQQQAVADAIREVQSDPLFRGGAWTGRGGGPAPMWGGGGNRGRGGEPPSR
jgi:hypothetical protein